MSETWTLTELCNGPGDEPVQVYEARLKRLAATVMAMPSVKHAGWLYMLGTKTKLALFLVQWQLRSPAVLNHTS